MPLVEEGWLDNNITLRIVSEYLGDLKKAGVKTLILGCTHYPLLKSAINKFMGKGVRLVDSAHETARTVKRVLKESSLLSDRTKSRSHRYFVTDEPANFKKVGEMFLGTRIGFIKKVNI